MSQDAWRVAFIAYYLLLGGASLLLIRPFGDWKSLGFRRPISWSSLFIIVAVTLTFHATKWNFHWDRITLMVSMEVVLASLAYTAFYQAYLIPAIESAGYSWGWAVFWCAMISATIRYPINVGGFEYYLFHGLILGVVFAARRNMIEIAGMRILASLILELGRV